MLNNFWTWFKTTHIGDLPSAALGGIIGFILVFVIEWFRSPDVTLRVAQSVEIEPQNTKKGKIPKRKILKLEVIVLKGWRAWLPISKNIHAFSKIRVELNWKPKSSYQAKWDNAPEPYDYINNVPKLEMTPLTMQPENLMFGENAQVGIVIKNDGDDGFYFFDSDYYVNPIHNHCTLKHAKLIITFKSSLTQKVERFIIKNPSKDLDKFVFEKA
ncbi:hypothetical protein M1328_00735 [Patescibacteria group bacterium]|nr:hypothetical protein [Patescibacteria group bacterium]